MRRLVLVCLLIGLLGIVGCGLDEGFEPPLQTDTLAGMWAGTWRSSAGPDRGRMTLDLETTDEQRLHGTMTLTGSPCVQRLDLTAELQGVSLSGDARTARDRVLFFGELSGDRGTLAGQYTVVRGQCAGDNGQWSVEQ